MASNPLKWLLGGIIIVLLALGVALYYQVTGRPEINPVVNILSVLFGAFLTAMIALSTINYLNEQNQRRQWLRDATRATYGPVYTEILQNMTNLMGLYPVVTEKWWAILQDPEAVVLDRKAHDDLGLFYVHLLDYQNGYHGAFDDARRIINETLAAEFARIHNPEIAGMASALQNDWEMLFNGDLQKLLHPNNMADFLRAYNNTVVKRDSTMTFLSAEELVRKIKQTVAADDMVKWLLATRAMLRKEVGPARDRLRGELQKLYGLKPD